MTTNGGTPTSCSAWPWFCRLRGAVGAAADGLVAVLYPFECVSCGRSLPARGILCEACVPEPAEGGEDRCSVCGAPVADRLIDLCLVCGTRERGFDRLVALGSYDGCWGELVRKLKFEREIAVGRWLSEQLAEAARRASIEDDLDVVTYVPMTPGERRRRGFNQAQVLARGVAAELGLPLRRSLVKRRRTRPQTMLPAKERRGNLQDAFRAVPSKCARALLIDDISTTGSTAEECARALRQAGFSSVRVLVVARA